MELIVIRHVQVEKYLKMVSVFVHQDNLKTMEDVSIPLLVKLDLIGMEKHAQLYHVILEHRSPVHAAAVKLLYTHVHQVLIGMVTDVFILLTTALLV